MNRALAPAQRRPGPSPTLLSVAVLLILAGCAHRTLITSEPPAAVVQVDRHVLGSTPVEVVVWSVPFTRPSATVTLVGYRTLVLDLRADRRPVRRAWECITFRWKQAFAKVPGQAHEVVLVPRHGPVGTWTEADVGR